MKRPEKKKELGTMSSEDVMEVRGYNRACNDYNMFLPSKDEITKMVDKKLVTSVGTSIIATSIKNSLIEAIAKRLGGK